MERSTMKQLILILKDYYQKGESSLAKIHRVSPIFSRNTGSVVDVKHRTQARGGRSTTNVAAVCESVGENLDSSNRYRAQQLDISIATFHRILTKNLNLRPCEMQLTQ